jgi:predicted MFS family arabinose efflux permease
MSSPAVLLRTPQVARLLAASLLGRIPVGMVPLALVLFSRDTGSGYDHAGLLTAAYSVGACLGGPALSRVMDVRGQTPTLVVSGLVSSLALAVLPWSSGWFDLLLALVAGLFTPPLEPALRTLWPVVLRPGQVPGAYAVDAAAQELIFVLGPLVVLAADAVGTGGGLVAAGLLGALGASWFLSARASRHWDPVVHEDRHWLGPLRSRRLVALYGVVALVGLTIGVPAVALVAYAESAGDRGMAPWLVAANALGALIGGITYSSRAASRDPLRDLPLAVAALAAAYLPLVLTPAPLLMGLAAVVSGVFLPATLTCMFQLVDRLAPMGTTTEAFAWLISAFLVGSSIGAAGAGALADAGMVGAAFVLASASAWAGAAAVRPVIRGA